VHAITDSVHLPEDAEWMYDKPFYVDFHGGCCATKRRIDLRVLLGVHGRYVFLRINPDPFVRDGQRCDPPFEERLKVVLRTIHDLISVESTSGELVQIHHLFYGDS
jgi:hypothetical protein